MFTQRFCHRKSSCNYSNFYLRKFVSVFGKQQHKLCLQLFSKNYLEIWCFVRKWKRKLEKISWTVVWPFVQWLAGLVLMSTHKENEVSIFHWKDWIEILWIKMLFSLSRECLVTGRVWKLSGKISIMWFIYIFCLVKWYWTLWTSASFCCSIFEYWGSEEYF